MQVPSINLKTKKFNQYPSKIIWIQLAGFDEEQIFQMHLKDGDTKKTSFDAFTCLGMHWEFNSYELQPASHLVMRSLITGKSNINGTCDDFYHAPLWSYYTNEKMQSVIIEKLADSKESILQIAECKDSHPKWNPQYYFKLDGLNLDKSTMKPFSVLERGKIKNPGKYYDASCNDKECNNDLLTSFSYIMDEVLRYEKNFNLIVRAFSAEKYFKKNEFEKWTKWIIEWSQVIS